MIIIPEERLDELFKMLPAIPADNGKTANPQFEFGTHKDLLRFLKDETRLKNYPYPLIFMETPIKATGNEEIIYFPLTLILATKTRVDFSPRERLKKTIEQRLKPLTSNILIALNEASITRIVKDRNNELNSFSTEIFYNYGNDEETEHFTTDIWDVIRLKLNLEMNNNCLFPITF